MMTRLLSSLGAFGASYALFSYFGGGALPYAICAALLAPLLSFALSRLPGRPRLPLLALLALLLLSLPLLVRDTFLSSLLSALIPLVDTLKEPYDIDMTAPLAKAIASPALAKGWLACLLSLFFTAGAWSKAARAMAALLSFFLILFGFYFGVNPPALAILCCASYGLSVFASLKNHGLGMPEIPTLALTLLLGAGLLLAFPESRYEQPAIFSHMQEKIIGWTDPYDPIFHAGNAYTGMMKGAAGHQRLGSSASIRYTGRVIADIEAASDKHLYIRSWTGGLYEDSRWKDFPDSTYDGTEALFSKNQGEWYDQGAWLMEVAARNPSISQKLLNYTKENDLSAFKKPFTLAALYEKSRFLLLPYDADFGGPYFQYDRSPISREGKAYSTDVWEFPAGALLSMMARESIQDPYYTTYLEAEKRYRRFVYAHYLTIPEETRDAIASLGKTRPAQSLSEKRARIDAIRHFLETNYTYTKNPDKTPADKDFISYFLTESRKGYCTSFASSAVMLLRASGIPARYAVGLSVDSKDLQNAPLTKEGLHALSVNDHHAHAWVEVYVDGLGWRPCEMTPGKEGAENPFPIPPDKQKNEQGAPDKPADEKNTREEAPKQQPPAPQRPQQQPQQQPEQQPQGQPPLSQPRTPDAPVSRQLLPMLLAVLLVLALLSAYPLYRMTAASRLLAKALTDDAHFKGLIAYTDRLSHWAGLPTRGSYEDRKSALTKDPRFAPFALMLDLLVTARFSGKPLTESEKADILAIVREARKQCLKGLSLTEKGKFLWKKL